MCDAQAQTDPDLAPAPQIQQSVSQSSFNQNYLEPSKESGSVNSSNKKRALCDMTFAPKESMESEVNISKSD